MVVQTVVQSAGRRLAEEQAANELAKLFDELGDAGSLRRFTIAEFYRLGELQIFQPDERIELIDGFLVVELPSTPAHAAVVSEPARVFIMHFGIDASVQVRTRNPITLEAFSSEPLPDIALVTARQSGYMDRHPHAAEIYLVVEVADTSLILDQTSKLDLYARAGIAEYWIINLVDRQHEVYREPYVLASGKAEYKTRLTFAPGDTVAPLAFPDCKIDLAEVFPK